MASSGKRFAMIGVLALSLAVAGIGVASATARDQAGPVTPATQMDSTAPRDAARDDDLDLVALEALALEPDAPGEPSAEHRRGGKRGHMTRVGRGERLERLVHAEKTMNHPDDGIVTTAVDHGTVTTVGGGSIAVHRADGQTITFTTTEDTKVRIARKKGELSDVKTGAEVLVLSRRDGDSWVAKRIIAIPPDKVGDGEEGAGA